MLQIAMVFGREATVMNSLLQIMALKDVMVIKADHMLALPFMVED